MDFEIIIKYLATGFKWSILIFALTTIFSLPLGMFVYFGRASKFAPFFFLKKHIGKNKNNDCLLNSLIGFRPISLLFQFIIAVLRGTPLMLQLLVVYFGPWYAFRIKLNTLGENWAFTAVIIGFVINYSAYFAEIYRGGIESISIGQYEAAEVLGYNRMQTFVKIILPQMIKRVIPATTNEIITLVKDTSLASVVPLLSSQTEMFKVATEVSSKNANIIPLIVAGGFYFIFNFIIAWAMGRLEKTLNYYR